MLEQILLEMNNAFVVQDGAHPGEYSITESGIALPFLADGQYFWIQGSVFNDGLHQYPASDLTDEDFTGCVYALAVPRAVVALADEIAAWAEKNQPKAYTSENYFGKYSYTLATNENGVAAGWQDVFRAQLNRWRKMGGFMFVSSR